MSVRVREKLSSGNGVDVVQETMSCSMDSALSVLPRSLASK